MNLAKEFFLTMWQVIRCQFRGHIITDEEIKRAVKEDMSLKCERCGIRQPIIINEEGHVEMVATGEPEIFISGADLGHVKKYV